MRIRTKIISVMSALTLALTASAAGFCGVFSTAVAESADISESMEWGAVKIGGGGFVSGIITGKNEMYARTDVGGAYKYNYETESWDQLLGFLNEEDKGFLSVDAMAIDPNDDDTVYMLCGCAYFSGARTAIFRTRDGGKTFDQIDVTDMIQVHGNGDGRHNGEAIAVDPDNPDIIYCGGDVASGDSALIWSQDGGDTWEPVKGYDKLGYYENSINWPTWDENHFVRAVGSGAYNTQNGVSTIAIKDGKVYVGTSATGSANVVVADVGSDDFKELSSELPTGAYPSRINQDSAGNLLITYVGGLAFSGTGGGAYKYNTETGVLTDISPTSNSFGGVYADPADPNKLLATTCGVWSAQLWSDHDWEDEKVCYGDWFYRSSDGGATWEPIVPGQAKHWNGPLQADYLQDGGYEWIRNKAIHWVGAIVLDPRDSDRTFVTSGNGVFACDNTWDELPQFYFHPDGIEEVVALDMVSVPGGSAFSAIGDYDGFEHSDVKEIGRQYVPNIGSTSAIAYCPQNPDVMVRIAEHNNDVASGLYSTDGGVTWTKMSVTEGGKAAITQLDDDTYRIFASAKGGGSYSDDFGKTWNSLSLSGLYYDMRPYFFVDPEDASTVYAYGYSQAANQWDTTPTEYKLYVSTDYGKTFSAPKSVCDYDYCDAATRIAYLGNGDVVLAGGWHGLYSVTDKGNSIEKLDVFYCKTVGYGAPEKEGDPNTLYMYGKPAEDSVEGIYRSQDGGKTWVCINTKDLYGGTGNGNFLVGDMNEFGKVYMSTVGCGIIYGQLSTGEKPVVTTTVTTEDKTQSTTTVTSVVPTDETEETTPSETVDPSKILYGDVDENGTVEVNDVVALSMYLLDKEANTPGVTALGLANADVEKDGIIDMSDIAKLINYLAELIPAEELGKVS